MLIVQLPPPADTVPMQSSVSVKSAVGAVMVEIWRGALPASIKVTVWAALLTLSAWLPKFNLAGARAIPGSLAESILAMKALPATPASADWYDPAITGKLVDAVLPLT